jgi:hypothetical protein
MRTAILIGDQFGDAVVPARTYALGVALQKRRLARTDPSQRRTDALL